MEVSIRRATPADARGVALVTVETWRAAYAGIVPDGVLQGLDVEERERRFRVILELPAEERALWVGVAADRLVGFVDFGPAREEDLGPQAGEIHGFYVLRAHWGTGLAQALFDRALADLRAAGRAPIAVWVLTENARARRFYERVGFELDPDRARVAKPARGVELDHARYLLSAGPSRDAPSGVATAPSP